MNLLRGTGPDGLAGIPSVRVLDKGTPVFRPLLTVNREAVIRYASAHRLTYCEDRTNYDPRFLRNWIRKTIFPQLEEREPGFGARFAQLGILMEAEGQYWKTYLEKIEQDLTRKMGSGRVLDLKGLLSYPAAVQRRLLRRVAGQNLLTFDGVEKLRRWMMSPPTNGMTWQLRRGWVAKRLSKSKQSVRKPSSSSQFWFGQIQLKKLGKV